MVKIGAGMALANVENQLLGFVQGYVSVDLFVGNGGNLSGSMNETAQNRGALDDAPVIFDISARWHLVDERGNIAGSAYILQLIAPLQLIADRNEIGRLMFFIKRDNDFVDSTMGIAIEILGAQKMCHLD